MLMLLESTLYLWAFNENRLKYNKRVNRSDFGASLCFPAACMALFLWSAYNSSLRMLYPNSWAGKPKRLKHSSSQIHKMNQYRISNCVFYVLSSNTMNDTEHYQRFSHSHITRGKARLCRWCLGGWAFTPMLCCLWLPLLFPIGYSPESSEALKDQYIRYYGF